MRPIDPHAISAFTASGAASLVESIEALTVVLAVGSTRGWRSALAGAAAGLLVLMVLVWLFGPLLRQLPLAPVRTVFGVLLLLFGARWLRKATRRAAGTIPLRDELASFRRHQQQAGGSTPSRRWSAPGCAASFQATLLEGLEVIFIVIAVGAGGAQLWRPAILGAALALMLVILLGVLLHRPITHVPENTVKRVVGALLCGFGTFWFGEGAGVRWPGGDLTLPALGVGYLLLSIVVAQRLRGRVPARAR